MQSDPAYAHIAPLLAACSQQAGPLLTAYRDLALSVGWHDLRALVLPGTEWAVILGHKRRDDPLRPILPLPLHTTALRPSSLRAIFAALSALAEDAETVPPALPALAPSVEELRARPAARAEGAHDAQGMQGVQHEADGAVRVDATQPASITARDPTGDPGMPMPPTPALDADTLYLAIATPDSTVVYYKLARGIRKPTDIPDEL
ncbi:hypothetical protein Q5752_000962 [Cryptotrichosporon argae]